MHSSIIQFRHARCAQSMLNCIMLQIILLKLRENKINGTRLTMLRLDTPFNAILHCSRTFSNKTTRVKVIFFQQRGVEIPAAGLDLTANRQQRYILLSPRGPVPLLIVFLYPSRIYSAIFAQLTRIIQFSRGGQRARVKSLGRVVSTINRFAGAIAFSPAKKRGRVRGTSFSGTREMKMRSSEKRGPLRRRV